MQITFGFCWDWVGTMVDRELDDNDYSEEVRKGWKGARCIDLMGYGMWK
jgi:hypothetical protein